MQPSRSAFTLAAFFAAALSALSAPPAAANLIVNGSFESGPTMPPGGLLTMSAGQNLGGWTVGGGGIDWVSDEWWIASQGTHTVGLNAENPGGIGQSFSTVPGATYRVTFWISGEPFTTPTIKTLRVRADGQFADFTYDSAPVWHWDMQYVQRTWTFTANGGQTSLEFLSLDPGDFSPVLDDVVVTQETAGVGGETVGLALLPPIPNPTHTGATIEFTLPSDGEVEVELFDMQGRSLGYLVEQELPAGRHRVRWDPRRTPDAKPGLYFVVMQAAGQTLVRRLSYLK